MPASEHMVVVDRPRAGRSATLPPGNRDRKTGARYRPAENRPGRAGSLRGKVSVSKDS